MRGTLVILTLAWVIGQGLTPWAHTRVSLWISVGLFAATLLVALVDWGKRVHARRVLRRNSALTSRWLHNLDHRRHESRHRR